MAHPSIAPDRPLSKAQARILYRKKKWCDTEAFKKWREENNEHLCDLCVALGLERCEFAISLCKPCNNRRRRCSIAEAYRKSLFMNWCEIDSDTYDQWQKEWIPVRIQKQRERVSQRRVKTKGGLVPVVKRGDGGVKGPGRRKDGYAHSDGEDMSTDGEQGLRANDEATTKARSAVVPHPYRVSAAHIHPTQWPSVLSSLHPTPSIPAASGSLKQLKPMPQSTTSVSGPNRIPTAIKPKRKPIEHVTTSDSSDDSDGPARGVSLDGPSQSTTGMSFQESIRDVILSIGASTARRMAAHALIPSPPIRVRTAASRTWTELTSEFDSSSSDADDDSDAGCMYSARSSPSLPAVPPAALTNTSDGDVQQCRSSHDLSLSEPALIEPSPSQSHSLTEGRSDAISTPATPTSPLQLDGVVSICPPEVQDQTAVGSVFNSPPLEFLHLPAPLSPPTANEGHDGAVGALDGDAVHNAVTTEVSDLADLSRSNADTSPSPSATSTSTSPSCPAPPAASVSDAVVAHTPKPSDKPTVLLPCGSSSQPLHPSPSNSNVTQIVNELRSLLSDQDLLRLEVHNFKQFNENLSASLENNDARERELEAQLRELKDESERAKDLFEGEKRLSKKLFKDKEVLVKAKKALEERVLEAAKELESMRADMAMWKQKVEERRNEGDASSKPVKRSKGNDRTEMLRSRGGHPIPPNTLGSLLLSEMASWSALSMLLRRAPLSDAHPSMRPEDEVTSSSIKRNSFQSAIEQMQRVCKEREASLFNLSGSLAPIYQSGVTGEIILPSGQPERLSEERSRAAEEQRRLAEEKIKRLEGQLAESEEVTSRRVERIGKRQGELQRLKSIVATSNHNDRFQDSSTHRSISSHHRLYAGHNNEQRDTTSCGEGPHSGTRLWPVRSELMDEEQALPPCKRRVSQMTAGSERKRRRLDY